MFRYGSVFSHSSDLLSLLSNSLSCPVPGRVVGLLVSQSFLRSAELSPAPCYLILALSLLGIKAPLFPTL